VRYRDLPLAKLLDDKIIYKGMDVEMYVPWSPVEYPLTRSERKRQRRAQANREARNRGWVTEWRKLGADPLEDRAARMDREPPEMRPWVVRQTSDNVRGALR